MTQSQGFRPDVFPYGWRYRKQGSLAGAWDFRRDPDGVGREMGWHEGRDEFPETMSVPGVPQAQGLGDPDLRQKSYFEGRFWVRRRFRLPSLDPNERIHLKVEGILPAARIYVNGSCIGYTRSSRTPQRVDITDAASPGQENLIAIEVCPPPEVRLDGLYEMPGLTVRWTGPYGRIAWEVCQSLSIAELCVQPDLDSRSVSSCIQLSRPNQRPVTLEVRVMDGDRLIGEAQRDVSRGSEQLVVQVGLSQFDTWSPDSPKLYTLEVVLRSPDTGSPIDRVGLSFGMRKFEMKGGKFCLNDKPVFLRFYGEDHLYPDGLCPPSEKEWYLPRLRRAREFGMNGAKGCVETFPPAYMEAADEVGLLLIQEMPFGLSGLRANRYTIDEAFREYYTQELEGIVRVSRNHPSILSYSMSSEIEFDKQTQESFDFFSRDLVLRARELAPGTPVVDCTGYSARNAAETPKGRRHTDYYVSLIPGMKDVLDEPAIDTDDLGPAILHEYHWWGCYPDIKDRAKYERTQMKPFWLDKLEATTRANGQEHLLDIYRRNSLWLQALCRKDGIEYVRRSQAEGYILWLLIDLGQWSEGLLDDFWQVRNVTPRELLESNADTVLVLNKEGNRCFTMGEAVTIPLAIDHYGRSDLAASVLRWELANDETFGSGVIEVEELTCGGLTAAGDIEVELPVREDAYRFELRVELRCEGSIVNTNHWSFWAFPEAFPVLDDRGMRQQILPSGTVLRTAARGQIPQGSWLVVADSVDDSLADHVRSGGSCVLFTRGAVIENSAAPPGRGNPYAYFRTIPWNRGDSGNSGTVVEDHPALSRFPHEGMCDLQFISMLKGRIPMDFGPLLDHGVDPIIRMIDHYAANRNNAHLLEFRVGSGRVIATSLGVLDKLDTVEARYLLHCLINYALSEDFAPTAVVPTHDFKRLFSQRSDEAKN